MQNTAPFNTNVPEFQPSREAPIYPGIVKRYPCQENVVSDRSQDVNQFLRSLTWKIQQPDSSMVWTSVKLVLPMKITTDANDGSLDTRVGSRFPGCNIALAETVMRVFRDTQLTINGKVFNDVNYYRDVLDACYRGVGPQSYGDNHSLKPIVTRALTQKHPTQTVATRIADGTQTANHVQIDDIRQYVTSNTESLLDNNGPFLERARLWQDGLSEDGFVWTGDVSTYLEAGPFQARARRGNTAVPYIKDFHLKLNFHQNLSRYDQLRNVQVDLDEDVSIKGRILAPRLLEFGTIPNMHVPGEQALATANFLNTIGTSFTRKPYLEVTYTKFLDPMRSSYLLRCYERQYQQSLPRFLLEPAVGGSIKKTARVTSRLLSYPTKIYLYAEVADEWKGSFMFGGVRRSCQLDNIHCRINQRPDVIYNPSQEECFETFQRHTNSSLEYGAWRKSPIYVFTPSDLRQSDMFANDARLTWMEWDADVSLTKLQNDEHMQALGELAISAQGYVRGQRDEQKYVLKTDWDSAGTEDVEVHMGLTGLNNTITEDIAAQAVEYYSRRTAYSTTAMPIPWKAALDDPPIGRPLVQIPYTSGTGQVVPTDSNMDVQLTNVTSMTQQLQGYVWALIKTNGASEGEIVNSSLYYIPSTYWFSPLRNRAFDGDEYLYVNSWSYLKEEHDSADDTYAYSLADGAYPHIRVFQGRIRDADANGLNNYLFGGNTDGAKKKGFGLGPYAYRFDGHGIRNLDGTIGEADQTYPEMGPLQFKAAPVGNQCQGADETDNTDRTRWCCFAPPESFFDSAHFKFRVNTFTTPDDNTTPIVHQAGAMVKSELGIQKVSFLGTARNAVVDPGSKTAFNSAPAPLGEFDLPVTRQMGELVIDPTQTTDDIPFEYQLKALYEYGNLQYEFNADGSPARVVDNLVPVGRSPGIPTF